MLRSEKGTLGENTKPSVTLIQQPYLKQSKPGFKTGRIQSASARKSTCLTLRDHVLYLTLWKLFRSTNLASFMSGISSYWTTINMSWYNYSSSSGTTYTLRNLRLLNQGVGTLGLVLPFRTGNCQRHASVARITGSVNVCILSNYSEKQPRKEMPQFRRRSTIRLLQTARFKAKLRRSWPKQHPDSQRNQIQGPVQALIIQLI